MGRTIVLLLTILGCITGCDSRICISDYTQEEASIWPDYKDVTIPPNIAPLNFSWKNGSGSNTALLIISGKDTLYVHSSNGSFDIPQRPWQRLLQKARGKQLTCIVCQQQESGWKALEPFQINVAEEEIDPYLAYRLIPPGYGLWNRMGIYQRNLENFTQEAIYKNTLGKGNCVNCHSFCNRNPSQMLFHLRSNCAGTYLLQDGKKEKLNTQTDHTLSPLVYPAWHPSGAFVAFSVNKTFQVFHTRHPNRIEVYDEASDVVIYDVRKHTVSTVPQLSSSQAYETFPTFSPDGKRLYFCSACAVDSMPQQYDQVKYSLCSITFDAKNGTFGSRVDTLYSAAKEGKSVSFPRVSPDGKWLVFTLSTYGNFSIWHKDADLYILNLNNGQYQALDALNSPDVESYHSWSSNSRWLVFSSRRDDGLYTRPYFSYIGPDGTARKPFLLPQRDAAAYYAAQMEAYNIPEFIQGKVEVDERELSDFAWENTGIQVK